MNELNIPEEVVSAGIAGTILRQLGGTARLSTMINGRNFFAIENGLSFHFSGSKKFNCVQIVLNSEDTYDVRFVKMGRFDITAECQCSSIYAESLINLIESQTGLYLRF